MYFKNFRLRTPLKLLKYAKISYTQKLGIIELVQEKKSNDRF